MLVLSGKPSSPTLIVLFINVIQSVIMYSYILLFANGVKLFQKNILNFINECITERFN